MIIKAESPKQAFDCPKYHALPESKKCQHYVGNGACGLSTAFMCIEWIKINEPEHLAGHLAALMDGEERGGDAIVETIASESPKAAGRATERPRAPKAPERAVAVEQPLVQAIASPLDPELLTDSALKELELAGVEAKISSADLGEVWLVPKLANDDNRAKLTYKMARSILVAMSVFPQATLVELSFNPTKENPSVH